MVRKIICKLRRVSNISSFLIHACQFVRFPSFSPLSFEKKKKKKPGLGKTGEGNSPHSWRHFGCLSLDIKHKPQLWWRHCGGPHLAQLPPSPLFGLNRKNKYEDLYKISYTSVYVWRLDSPLGQQLCAFCIQVSTQASQPPYLEDFQIHSSRFDSFIYSLMPLDSECWTSFLLKHFRSPKGGDLENTADAAPFSESLAWHRGLRCQTQKLQWGRKLCGKCFFNGLNKN